MRYRATRCLFLLFLFNLLLLTSVAFVAAQSDDAAATDPSGQIVYIGEDYNVYSYDFAATETFQLTDDASPRRHYQWPTWSQDGRLAYFCCDLQVADNLGSQAFISQDGREPGALAYDGNGETIIYAAWSPAACTAVANCLDLALLVNDVLRGGLSVEILRDAEDGPTSDLIAIGSPFYYSWSPQGDRLIFHRNSRRVDIYDVATGRISPIGQASSGAFQAPAWSPVDDRVLFGARGSERATTDLVVVEGTQTNALIRGIRGQISFSWSPDGRYIAYRVATRERYGSLFVIDSVTGALVSRSSTDGVLGFFWSPDSQQVAYVTVAYAEDDFDLNAGSRGLRARPAAQDQGREAEGLAWSTLNIADGFNRQHAVFAPTREFVYLLLYFDQFARSHQVWSPDSTHLVYSEFLRRAAPTPVVSALDVTQPNAQPQRIAEGVFAVWSFN